VAQIVPVIGRRTDAHLASAAAKRVERWRRIAIQAAEQSRRIAPPEFSEPVKLQAAVSLPGSMKIVLSEAEQDAGLRDVILANENASDALLAIGPEGGWTIDELDLFRKEGWVSASLGPTILRAETAAIAAVAITTSLLS